MNLFKYKIINNSIQQKEAWIIFKRFKSKKGLKLKETGPCINALNHFDDFYSAIFGEKWPSVRLGLLSKQKYFAVINNFGEVEKTKKLLENLGAFDLKSFFEIQKNFVELSSAENLINQNKVRLDDMIKDKLQKEEKHPDGVEFKMRVHDFNTEKEENEKIDDYIDNPEQTGSSLTSDMKMSQIDINRIIMPNARESPNLFEFMPATKLAGVKHFIPETEYYKYYKIKQSELISLEDEIELDFPENLKVYSFDRGEIRDFPEPIKCVNNVYNYLKLDGADVLTTLALGVQPSDVVLDMCSTSENITFCIFQTLRPKLLICTNDKKNKTGNLFSQYIFDESNYGKEMLYVTSSNLDKIQSDGMFDKVLVDVPCTFDRTSLFETEGNVFQGVRVQERLRLPELQCSFLIKALKLVRPGGTVLYTTSTLSPVQNDGVVCEALKIIRNENKVECTVKNLSPALRHTSLFFNYGDYLNLKFGTLVVPFAPSNFGPKYFCKIIRNEQK